MADQKHVSFGRKIAAVGLGITLALGSVAGPATTAFALTNSTTSAGIVYSTGNVTWDGLEDGVTATTYKIVDVNWDTDNDQPTEPMYTWANASIDSWVSDNFSSYHGVKDMSVSDQFTDALSDDGDITTNHTAANNGAATFYDKLAQAIKAGNPAVTGTDTTSGMTTPAAGVYLTLFTGGVKSYRPTVTTVLPKYNETTSEWDLVSETPTIKSTTVNITKKADDTTTYVGQTVNYTVTIDVPVYPVNAINKTFEFEDQLPAGVTLDATNSATNSSGITVVGKKVGGTTEDLSGSLATITTNYGGMVAMNMLNMAFDYSAISEYEQLTISYSGTVNPGAVVGTGNTNNAIIRFASDPYTTGTTSTNSVSEDVYTYGIHVDKVDEEGEDLSGATFQLSGMGIAPTDADAWFKKIADGKYEYVGTSDPGVTGSVNNRDGEAIFACDNTGNLEIYGLETGSYTLTELTAPGGYMKLSDPLTITITDGDAHTPADGIVDANALAATGEGAGYVQATVINKKAWTLPKTGGVAPLVIATGSLIAVVGYKLHKRSEQE